MVAMPIDPGAGAALHADQELPVGTLHPKDLAAFAADHRRVGPHRQRDTRQQQQQAGDRRGAAVTQAVSNGWHDPASLVSMAMRNGCGQLAPERKPRQPGNNARPLTS
jgi:hypothetical protein